MFLQRKEAKLAAKLDRMLAGEPLELPAGLLEEKVWQVLHMLENNEQKRQVEQENITRMMSDVSHQLKTPLVALMLHLDLASDVSLSSEERERFLSESQIQAAKIEWLSEVLLKVARLETGLIAIQKMPTNLIQTVKEAIFSIRAATNTKGLSIIEHVPETLIIEHDPVRTKEALTNLLDNAVKYTDSGEITVTIEQGPIYTRIDIADTGIGLAESEYTKVFTRFYRVRGIETQRVEGTGLGLTIAREILRCQGGNITVVSEMGKGSVFSVFLQNC